MTVINRKQGRQAALTRAQGFVEPATSADTTTVTSLNMIGRGGDDDTIMQGWGLYEPTDDVADAYRIVTLWDASAGKATIPLITTGRTTEDHEWYPRGDPGPFEYNAAINEVLAETERKVETVIPTYDGNHNYSLANAPWIRTELDVLDVYRRLSPNVVENSGFEFWGTGAGAGPTGWSISGTGAIASRVRGSYERFAMRLTSTGGAGAVATQTIDIPIVQLYGKTLAVFGRIKSGTADMASIDVLTDATPTQSTQHDGGGDWDEFSFTHTVEADAAGPLQIKCTLDATDGSADYEIAVMVVGSTVPVWLQKYGDQYAATAPLRSTVQMRASQPAIVTNRAFGQGEQLVVVSLQPYSKLTSDVTTNGVTDIPLEALASGVIAKLAVRQFGRPNAAKWGALHRIHKAKYDAWSRALAAPPRKVDRQQVVIGGA